MKIDLKDVKSKIFTPLFKELGPLVDPHGNRHVATRSAEIARIAFDHVTKEDGQYEKEGLIMDIIESAAEERKEFRGPRRVGG